MSKALTRKKVCAPVVGVPAMTGATMPNGESASESSYSSVSVAVVTVLYAVGEMLLHFLIGDPVSVRRVLLDSLVPSIAFNLILTAPVYWLVKKLLRPPAWGHRAHEVRLLG